MKPLPMEERLSNQWSLNTEEAIRAKIFENYEEGDNLIRILDSKKLVVCSYALGSILAGKLRAAQLRRLYESLLKIKAIVGRIKKSDGDDSSFRSDVIPHILMLKPQLAYAKERQRSEITPLFEVINPLLDLVKDVADFERLCDFVQAVVAYHKYCGGRD